MNTGFPDLVCRHLEATCENKSLTPVPFLADTSAYFNSNFSAISVTSFSDKTLSSFKSDLFPTNTIYFSYLILLNSSK